MKLQCKIRQGSRLIRSYDTPRTLFERVVESRKGDRKKLAALAHTLKTTDLFELSGYIDQPTGATLQAGQPGRQSSAGKATAATDPVKKLDLQQETTAPTTGHETTAATEIRLDFLMTHRIRLGFDSLIA